MTVTGYPFDNADSNETQFSMLFRELQDSGVADSIGGSSFLVGADSSGMHASVQPGFAIVRGFAVESTDVESVTIDPANTSTRYDIVVLRLSPAANAITIAVVKGTAGAGAPALTQTSSGVYELPIATVTVPGGASAIRAVDVADTRTFVGQRVGAWLTSTRPSDPRKYRMGYNATSGRWEYWTGSAWVDLAPTVTWDTISGAPTSFEPAAHTHPWSQLTDVPAAFTPTTHSHSWDSILGKPSTYAPTSHAHAWSEITDKPGTFPPDSHSHYYGEIGGLNGILVWLADTKSDKGHTHDAPWTVGRANGSDRVHGYGPAGSGYYAVWCDGNHDFCHNTSSIRYKTNVRDHIVATENALKLRPVVYDRKDSVDKDGAVVEGARNEFGLIAEEVAECVPEIVQWMDDEDGTPQIESVRYDLLGVAMIPLLQSLHARVEALEAKLAEVSC